MQEALVSEVKSYLESQNYGAYMATMVRYGNPVDISFRGINLLLFEGLDAEIKKTGQHWVIQFQPAPEHSITMNASILAVVTQYWRGSEMGFSGIYRLEETKDCLNIKPTPFIDVLPGQTSSGEYISVDSVDENSDEVGEFIPVFKNRLRSKNIVQAAQNHNTLVERLLALTSYNPNLVGTIPIPTEYIIDDRIPLL